MTFPLHFPFTLPPQDTVPDVDWAAKTAPPMAVAIANGQVSITLPFPQAPPPPRIFTVRQTNVTSGTDNGDARLVRQYADADRNMVLVVGNLRRGDAYSFEIAVTWQRYGLVDTAAATNEVIVT